MSRTNLTDEQWSKIVKVLRAHPNVYVGKEAECRLFLEAVLWVDRTGAQWRMLPEKYGKWNSIYKRFARWCDSGVWAALLEHCAQDADWSTSLLTALLSAPITAPLAPQKRGGQAEQALGRSLGGFSTKIHISVDGLGNPLRFRLTGGQRHDITQAAALIEGLVADYVIADRAYDALNFLEFVMKRGAQSVIPATPRRNQQREHDRHLYKERHLVECFINKIKHYRRVFSRFEKLASRYLGFLQLTAVLIWLR